MAENSAGRSEVTFKAWFNPAAADHRPLDNRPATGVVHDGGDKDKTETKSEVLIGASLGTAAVVLAGVAVCAVFAVRRRQLCHRKYAYYVRDNHDNGTIKVSPAHTTSPSWIRRLRVRGRRLFRRATVVEDPRDGDCGVGNCDAADDDDDDDKLVSSTLQSLLEAKQLFDQSLARVTTHDDETQKERVEHDELLHAVELGETREEPDVDRCPCDHDITADDSASKTETDSELTGQDEFKEAAPDLLTGDGHTFRRGGVARSPYRRSKHKVSFADCRSPSSDLMSGDSTSSSTPHQQVAASDDGADSASVSRGVSRHSCCVVDLADSSSRTGVGSVRRSQSTNAVTASRFSQTLKMPQERRWQPAAAGGRHNALDAGRIDIALPATISGVTEGLFPPMKPVRTYQWKAGGEGCPRLGPRLSEPTIRRTTRNILPRTVTQGTEV